MYEPVRFILIRQLDELAIFVENGFEVGVLKHERAVVRLVG